jgi:hypothetical protein
MFVFLYMERPVSYSNFCYYYYVYSYSEYTKQTEKFYINIYYDKKWYGGLEKSAM